MTPLSRVSSVGHMTTTSKEKYYSVSKVKQYKHVYNSDSSIGLNLDYRRKESYMKYVPPQVVVVLDHTPTGLEPSPLQIRSTSPSIPYPVLHKCEATVLKSSGGVMSVK